MLAGLSLWLGIAPLIGLHLLLLVDLGHALANARVCLLHDVVDQRFVGFSQGRRTVTLRLIIPCCILHLLLFVAATFAFLELWV